jgi:exonuclease III
MFGLTVIRQHMFGLTVIRQQLIHILNFAKSKKIQILCLTEFDLNHSTELNSIQVLLSNFDFKIELQSARHRTAIVYHTSLSITTQNSFSIHNQFNPTANPYVSDITISFKEHELTIFSVYVPVYNNRDDNPFHIINKNDFINAFCHTITSISQTGAKLLLCGDWNTKPMESTNLSPIESFLHQSLSDTNLYDIFFLPINRRSINYTNHGTRGANNRLDRFYTSFQLLEEIKFKYKVHPKLPFSTHRPVECTLSYTDENTTLPHLNRKNSRKRLPAILQYILEHDDFSRYIFSNEDLITTDPSNDYNAYMQRVGWKTATVLKIMKFLPSYRTKKSAAGFAFTDPQFHNIAENLSTNYKRLRLRFGKHSKEATLDDETVSRATEFYSSLFSSNELYSNNSTINKFEEFTEHIKEGLTQEEQASLVEPFTQHELHRFLIRLNENGPSSPGTDGITYRDWRNNWTYAVSIITSLANYILEGKLRQTDGIGKVLIKLIPKKSYREDQPSIDDLRPISLTNSSLRLINFSLSKRIMPIANRLITFHQQAFMTNRNIHLHIETARALSHKMCSSTTSSNIQHLFLVDLKKAFDSIDHHYIQILLNKYGFPKSIIQAVLTQSVLAHANILNDKLISKTNIYLTRGVRQGLPFSPLIFNMAIQPLISKLHITITGMTFNPYSEAQLDPNIHINVLAFADDL